MSRKKKKSIEKTARKGIKKELSLQLAGQLQNVFNQFGDESKKSTKAISQASKSLAKKLTPLAKIDKSVIKKTMQKAYSQDSQPQQVSNPPALARNATAGNTQPATSKSKSGAPARSRITSPPTKGVPALKTPIRKQVRPQVPAAAVPQKINENQSGAAIPPSMDQT